MTLDTAPSGRGQALAYFLPAIPLAAVGAAITAFDAVFMAQGAAAMAPGAHTGPLLAGVAVCAAIFKAGWLSAVRCFLMRRAIFLALAALAFGLLTHVFSMTATIGITAGGRDSVISDRSREIEHHKRAQAAYDAARDRKAIARATRPVAAVRGDLTAIETEISDQARREEAERATICGTRCDDAVRKGEAAKTRRATLQAELASALEAAKADEDLRVAKVELDGIKTPGAADPQAVALATYVPLKRFTEREAALMLPLLPSLIVEFGGPICFLLAGALFAIGRGHWTRGAMKRPARGDDQPSRAQAVRVMPVSRPAPQPIAAIEARPELRRAAPKPAPRRTSLLPAMRGAEIAALRAALNEGQDAFASRFGVSVRTVRRWENEERPMPRDAVLRARAMAAELGNPTALLGA